MVSAKAKSAGPATDREERERSLDESVHAAKKRKRDITGPVIGTDT